MNLNALLQSDQGLYKQLFDLFAGETGDCSLCLLDENGLVAGWNAGAERLFRYTEAEAAHLPGTRLFADLDLAPALARALGDGLFSLDTSATRNGGSTFPVNLVIKPFYVKSELVGYSVLCRSLFYEKKAAETLQSGEPEEALSNNLFRQLIANSYSGISLFDANLNILYRSASATRITGFTTKAREESSADEMIHPEDRSLVKQVLEELLAEPGSVRNCTFRTRHFDGHFIDIECAFTNCLNLKGIEAIVLNFRDVTAQAETRRLYAQSMAELSAYKAAIDEAAIVAVTDQRGRITHVNDTFCKISGYSREELLGQDHRLLNSGFHDSAFIRDLWTTIANGRVWRGDLRNRAKDGSIYWVASTIVPFLNEAGKPYQYIAIRFDITGLKRVEKELRDKNDEIGSLLESISDGFIAVDNELRYLYVNPRICELVGMKADDMIGRKMWDLFPDAVGSATYQAIERALKEKIYIRNEDYYEPLDLWQENRIYPSANGLSLFISDISERKRSETQIRRLNERFELIARVTNDALFDWNLSNDDVWWSESHHNLFGTPATPSRDAWLDRIHPDHQRQIRETLDRVYQNEVDKWEIEVDYFKSDQSRGTLLNRGVVLRSRDSKPLRLLGSFIDISDRKEEERQQALLADITLLFAKQDTLSSVLNEAMALLLAIGPFRLAETWLTGLDNDHLYMVATAASADMADDFLVKTRAMRRFEVGHGLPGITWTQNAVQFWENLAGHPDFLRKPAFEQAGVSSAFGIPLLANQVAIGVVVLGLASNERPAQYSDQQMATLGAHLGGLIRRKQLERELQSTFESVADIICIVGVDRMLKKVNRAMCELLGWSEEELLARSLDQIIHPGDMAESLKRTERLKRNDVHRITFEGRYITADGRVLTIEWSVSKAAEKGVLFCVGRDITERKKAEKDLQQRTGELVASQRRYSNLFHMSPLPMFVFDTETLAFLDVNHAAVEHYHYSRDEFRTMTLRDIRPPEEIARLNDVLKKTLRENYRHLPGVFTHRKKNGELIQVEIVSSKLQFMDRPARLALVIDVTERNRHLEAIEAQNKQLREISWMQSHVVRAPLSRIMGLVNLILTGLVTGEELNEYLGYLDGSARELDDVIKAIVDKAATLEDLPGTDT